MSARKTPAEKLEAISAIDREYWAQGIVIAGIDEAGRGPLAGPVAAGCVIMPQTPLLEGIDDSKKLSEKKRDMLFDAIAETAVFAQVGIATVAEIDEMNILEATRLAMRRAAEGASCNMYVVDGMSGLLLPRPQRSIIQGDALCYSIAAASIIAKVTRDRMLLELDAQYPQYGFARHKGYGTAAHIAAIREHGPCPEHRSLFIRKFI